MVTLYFKLSVTKYFKIVIWSELWHLLSPNNAKNKKWNQYKFCQKGKRKKNAYGAKSESLIEKEEICLNFFQKNKNKIKGKNTQKHKNNA